MKSAGGSGPRSNSFDSFLMPDADSFGDGLAITHVHLKATVFILGRGKRGAEISV